ncbi:glycoside hydrolase family 78 protein [Thermothelomyces thermophilus ATCC 42464]|uniref:Glycoside hydrolase family 78 protein n=1 Tax=Thermothelomyces thermophilus (strain ATCC 42464 / BCRC 31852 / DSM 1799) TaxID=573729 RepID=G2Q0R0_THET4|nr:glycoside hydrolase family 78 protein [Thermothelomyces thermophilus ATCC 42464]AEO55772.1 glycoside hydrolase family 78 protein [Thermothelomyces thermophilus ATCC 42464]
MIGLISLGLSAIAGAAVTRTHLHLPQAGVPLITVQDGPIVLSSTTTESATLVLDYGANVEGIPSFEVVGATGDTTVFEITYSESKAGLDLYMGDGPIPLAAAMDTYRVNRYNIVGPEQFTNRHVQGAFRYQKLNLSSPGELTLQNVGVIPTTRTTSIDKLPGSFKSSDSSITDIWAVGARTIQLTEIPKDSIPEFWEITSEGAVIDSLAPQANGAPDAVTSTAYNLDFKVKPLIGGFGFSVLSDTLNSAIYISVDAGARTIAAYVGSTTEDTELTRATVPSNVTMALGSWHSVHVEVAMTDIAISINGERVLKFTQYSKFYGSYGLGASFGHKAVFRDLVATDPVGTVTYQHPLNDKSCLKDFLLGTNPLDVSVDGSRRDRIAYAGDLDIAASAALVSTHGLEFVEGALNLLASMQATPGFFIPTVKIQQRPLSTPLDVNITGLIGYSWNLLTAVSHTYMHTGDLALALEWAPRIVRMLDWSHSQTLSNGLFNLSDATFGGDWNYYDPAQSGVVTKFNVLYAYALQETVGLLADVGVDISVYQDRLAALRAAIDKHLWSDELGAYVYADGIRDGFGQDSNAIAILAGVNLDPSHSSETILSTLSRELSTPKGPLSFSSGVLQHGFQRYISPYASAYHLRAAFTSQNSTAARELLDSLWAPMTDTNNANYSGCFWETLDETGRPAFGVHTSLCHGWSAGPTAELSRFVLGAQPTKPGWAEWAVSPQTLGLTSARGEVPTPLGPLTVSWEFCGTLLNMSVEAPAGTTGLVNVPYPLLVPVTQSKFIMNGSVVNGTTLRVKGGSKVTIMQLRK